MPSTVRISHRITAHPACHLQSCVDVLQADFILFPTVTVTASGSFCAHTNASVIFNDMYDALCVFVSTVCDNIHVVTMHVNPTSSTEPPQCKSMPSCCLALPIDFTLSHLCDCAVHRHWQEQGYCNSCNTLIISVYINSHLSNSSSSTGTMQHFWPQTVQRERHLQWQPCVASDWAQ